MRVYLALPIGAAAAVAVWLYLRSRESSAPLTTFEAGDPAGLITHDAPNIQVDMPTLAPIEVEFTILETVAVRARQIAGTVSSWFNPNGEKYRPLFDAAERANGIPHGLLFRQAYQESRFRDDIITGKVRSSAGAVGIMQIIPRWHPEVGEVGALNPATAIPYAAKYLSQLKKQFGSWELALAAYNWGPGNVKKYPADKWPLETRNYVSQITADINVRNA